MAELPQPVPGEVISTATFGIPVVGRVVSRYASVADRNSKAPSPENGEACYLQDLKVMQVYDGTSWNNQAGQKITNSFEGDQFLLNGLFQIQNGSLRIVSTGSPFDLMELNNGELNLYQDGQKSIRMRDQQETSGEGIAITKLAGGGSQWFDYKYGNWIFQVLSDASSNPRIIIRDGSPSIPAIGFDGSNGTGIYRNTDASHTLGIATAGDTRVKVAFDRLELVGTSMQLRAEAPLTTGTAANATWVSVTGGYRLQRFTSSKRYKKNIRSLVTRDRRDALDIDLRPVTFDHKGDLAALEDPDQENPPGTPRYFGFIAEEVVEALGPDAAILDPEGQIDSYDLAAVVAVLAAQVSDLRARLQVLEG